MRRPARRQTSNGVLAGENHTTHMKNSSLREKRAQIWRQARQAWVPGVTTPRQGARSGRTWASMSWLMAVTPASRSWWSALHDTARGAVRSDT